MKLLSITSMTLIQHVAAEATTHPPWPHRHAVPLEVVAMKLVAALIISLLIAVTVVLRRRLRGRQRGRPGVSMGGRRRRR